MPRTQRALRGACALVLLALVPRAGAAGEPTFAALGAALTAVGSGELVVFDPPPTNRVRIAARIAAPAARVRALLDNPASYRAALPELIKAEVVAQVAQPPLQTPDLLLAWELEVPLWNLKGRLWLRARGDVITLELLDGDLAPGAFVWSVYPEPTFGPAAASGGEPRTLLVLAATANVANANVVTRQVSRRAALAAPAMTVTAAWVLLRAMALAVTDARAPRWPHGPPAPPAPAELADDRVVTAASVLSDPPVLGWVASRADGRLRTVALSLTAGASPARAAAQLREGARWRALPGWRRIELRAAAPGHALWRVDASFPFVDFDADWAVDLGEPLAARAAAGDTAGAAWSWLVRPGPAPERSRLAFVSYPRIEKTGYLPRKLIAAEPLLEHALSLALAYVDAVALSATLGR